jgi:hypothetical protein
LGPPILFPKFPNNFQKIQKFQKTKNPPFMDALF